MTFQFILTQLCNDERATSYGLYERACTTRIYSIYVWVCLRCTRTPMTVRDGDERPICATNAGNILKSKSQHDARIGMICMLLSIQQSVHMEHGLAVEFSSRSLQWRQTFGGDGATAWLNAIDGGSGCARARGSTLLLVRQWCTIWERYVGRTAERSFSNLVEGLFTVGT